MAGCLQILVKPSGPVGIPILGHLYLLPRKLVVLVLAIFLHLPWLTWHGPLRVLVLAVPSLLYLHIHLPELWSPYLSQHLPAPVDQLLMQEVDGLILVTQH